MEDQASSMQLDMKDNGLSYNGNIIEKIEVTEAATIQSQKVVENSIEVEASNGINLLDDATSTTTEPITDQIAVDTIKKMQNSTNGLNLSTEASSIDNHQGDDLIRELAQFEGVKMDDEVTFTISKATSEENGGNLQDTSDLLKDLESDSPGPSGPSESEIENAAASSVKDSVEVQTDDKTDDVQVDSTTESSQKRKHSIDSCTDNAFPKRANVEDFHSVLTSTEELRPPPRSRVSEGSDFSDSIVEKKKLSVEFNRNFKVLAKILKYLTLITEYLGNDPFRDFDDLLGPMPRKKTLFRGKHFLLTCTIPMKKPRSVEVNNGTEFGTTPFYKEHLREQIEMGGGIVYSFFEDIPKAQYKNCKLIAHHPCITVKFVQCLAANIMPLNHEWIIDCCTNNEVRDIKPYILPCGWSIIDNQYKEWVVSRSKYSRNNIQPLKKTTVLTASHHQEFTDFWLRVCKLAGATTRSIKSLSDVTKTTKGFMLTDDDFSEEIKLKAEHFKIPVVSTVWVVQSLIMGEPCDPEVNVKLKQVYEDDDY